MGGCPISGGLPHICGAIPEVGNCPIYVGRPQKWGDNQKWGAVPEVGAVPYMWGHPRRVGLPHKWGANP